MRQKELLDSIKKYLARFEAQVRISTLNNEYDINIHAENVVIPILDLLYRTNLKNANFSEGKNNEAIDLIDEGKRIAFQVTSTKGISKIKNTISKFVKSKYKNKIDVLFIYILTKKQEFYTQDVLDKASEKKIKFNAKKNVIDSADIYRKICELNDLTIIEKIEQILRTQFSDIFINKTFTLSNLEDFRNRYTKSCISNFSRINFFGLSVRTNKPREIELYLLFVNPTFSSSRRRPDYLMTSDDLIVNIDTKWSNLNTYSESSTLKSSKNLESYFSHLDVSKYFTTNKLISLDNTKTLNLFETFYSALQKTDEIPLSDFFSGPKNVVVIGKPGAGKSSFIKYCICKILERDKTVFESDEIYEFIPFRIELHKFNKFKKAKNGNIIEYLSELLESEHQCPLSPENIYSIIRSTPSLFFFDGLDEIFDIQERLTIRNDIETFVKSYHLTRSVVTSRYESYEEVRLSEREFAAFELLDFTDKQVDEYVRKWYTIEESDSAKREKESSNCLLQLGTVESELKHNPLLLSLILLLYRNELDIPTSKLNIYESCTNTIVETRDVKEKKLDIKLKIVNKISVFASLAYWQFKNESEGKTSSSFDKVRNYIKNYLLEKGEFEEENLSEQATDEFLQFAKIRSIYFENKFTHKTFLEYFTAYYIFSYYYGNWRKFETFLEVITSYIGQSSWSVVLELLICKIDANQINYQVIDELIEKLYKKKPADTLAFCLQILKYLNNISPKMIRFIIDKAIEFCFKEEEITGESKTDYQEPLFAHLCALGNLDRFKEIIENSFSTFITTNNATSILINAFAFEFAIVSGNTSLVKILQSKNLESNNEYIFILRHYPNLFDDVKYLDSLKAFLSMFPTSSTAETYRSPFKQKIFFNSDKFNWIITYLSRNISKDEMKSIYQQLLSTGVSKEVLIEAAKEKSVEIPTLQLEKHLNRSDEKDSSYKKFLKTLRDTFLSPIETTESRNKGSQKIQFYDKFFVSHKKAHRSR